MDTVNSAGGGVWGAFKEAVLPFESRVDAPRNPVALQQVASMLLAITAMSDALDLVKKSIFYGKELGGKEVAQALARVYQHTDEAAAFNNRGAQDARGTIPAMGMRRLHALMGMVTEAGEIAAAAGTALRHFTDVDLVNVLEEVGDFHWYEAVLLDDAALPLTVPLEMCAQKLVKRYGSKYNDQGALNRDLAAERSTLEQGATATPYLPPVQE